MPPPPVLSSTTDSPRPGPPRTRRRGLRLAVQRVAEQWARRRQGTDAMPLTLERRRIYILPTRQGVVFGALLLAMLLASLNYNNSLGLALTFLLAGVGLVTMHFCHRNLLETRIRFAGAAPVFAGEDVWFQIALDRNIATARYNLRLKADQCETDAVDLVSDANLTLTLPVATHQRGLFTLQRFGISTTFPLGLFRAWAWVYADLNAVVYPRPADTELSPRSEYEQIGDGGDMAEGDLDFAGLRLFRPGDPPRRIAWKAFARDGQLQIKQFSGSETSPRWIDWDALPGMDMEPRLEQLCQWVVDAQASGRSYGLRLPERVIAPGLGAAHEEQCLTALAMM